MRVLPVTAPSQEVLEVGFTLSEGIIIALLGLIGVVTTALLTRQNRQQAKQERWAKETHHEVRNNGGSSMKDAVDRIERRQTDMMHVLDLHGKDLAHLKESSDNTYKNVERLRDYTTELDKKIDRHHPPHEEDQ